MKYRRKIVAIPYMKTKNDLFLMLVKDKENKSIILPKKKPVVAGTQKKSKEVKDLIKKSEGLKVESFNNTLKIISGFK